MWINKTIAPPRTHPVWKIATLVTVIVASAGVVGAVKNLRSPSLASSSEAGEPQDHHVAGTNKNKPKGLEFRRRMMAAKKKGGAAVAASEWKLPREHLLSIGANMNDRPQRKLTPQQLFPVGNLHYSSVQKNAAGDDVNDKKQTDVALAADITADAANGDIDSHSPRSLLEGELENFEGLDDECPECPECPVIKTCPVLNINCGECLVTSTYQTTFTTLQGVPTSYCFTRQTCFPVYLFSTNGACAGTIPFTNNCLANSRFDSTTFIGTDGPLCQLNARRNLGKQQDANDKVLFGELEDDDSNKTVDGDDKDAKNALIAFVLASVLAFVRIPKTGSTSILKYLDQAEHLYPWDMHLPKQENNKKKQQQQQQQGPSSIGNCILGYAPSKKQLGNPTEPFWNGCPHVTYGRLVEYWAKTLPSWSPPGITSEEHAVDVVDPEDESGSDSQHTLMFDAFTIVRDPFDRLVSYFFYLRKFTDTNEFLKHTASVAQYERVKANDLEGWMKLLHIEDGGCGLELPYEYKYIHEDIDEAIALIQNDASPQVFALLTECMEASLHLLAETFAGFESGSVDAFVKSEDFRSNSNSAVNKKDRPDQETLDKLRAQAEIWFADDFKFYKVAVEQFKEKLANSNLSTIQLETCKYWFEDEAAAAAEVASLA